MTVNSSQITNKLLFVLSFIGLLIAIYVTQSFVRNTGIVCVNSGCELVRKSAYSYMFGFFPVPAVGLIGYTILCICAFITSMVSDRVTRATLSKIMLAVSLFGVLFVSWFTYMELFIIKGVCTWCAISAVNMYIILGLCVQPYLHKKTDSV